MLKARDIMVTEFLTVSLDTPVKKLAGLLVENDISGAPVLDEHERLVGVVTENDLIDQKKKLHLPTVVTLFESVFYFDKDDRMEKEFKKMLGTTVRDIYSMDVVTIHEDTELDEIATIISEKKIHLLPVMRGEEVVGLIGKADIVRAIASRL